MTGRKGQTTRGQGSNLNECSLVLNHQRNVMYLGFLVCFSRLSTTRTCADCDQHHDGGLPNALGSDLNVEALLEAGFSCAP